MAYESPWITGAAVEATEYPHLVQKYGVMGVPRSVFNESTFIEGAVPETSFLEAVLEAAAASSRS